MLSHYITACSGGSKNWSHFSLILTKPLITILTWTTVQLVWTCETSPQNQRLLIWVKESRYQTQEAAGAPVQAAESGSVGKGKDAGVPLPLPLPLPPALSLSRSMEHACLLSLLCVSALYLSVWRRTPCYSMCIYLTMATFKWYSLFPSGHDLSTQPHKDKHHPSCLESLSRAPRQEAGVGWDCFSCSL